jgi:hypothetical protein
LLAAVDLLESNWKLVQNVLQLTRRVLTCTFIMLWPKKKEEMPVDNLRKLLEAFDTPEDPVLAMECRSVKWGIKGAIALAQSCGDPDLPPGIPVMHTIHDPRKTVVNPHNRVGITKYIIHYIASSNSLTWPLGQIQMPRRASSLSIAADTRVALGCV